MEFDVGDWISCSGKPNRIDNTSEAFQDGLQLCRIYGVERMTGRVVRVDSICGSGLNYQIEITIGPFKEARLWVTADHWVKSVQRVNQSIDHLIYQIGDEITTNDGVRGIINDYDWDDIESPYYIEYTHVTAWVSMQEIPPRFDHRNNTAKLFNIGGF